MLPLARLRRPSRLTAVLLVAIVVLATAGGAIAGGAMSVPTFVPTSADQVTNLDILRSQIKNYYGTPTAATGMTNCNKDLAPGADSNYSKEAAGVAADGSRWLSSGWRPTGATKAIVLDVDDTTLATWNYELCSNWAFDPVTNGQFVTDQRFPAVPGMVQMVSKAAADGYAIFFVTGRGQAQEAATLGNLTHDGIGVDAGYPAPTTLNNGEDGLFTKPPVGSYPAYLDKPEFCAAAIAAHISCPTIQYKSGVRAHIEDLGYEIVGNFGDQFSDLKGGFADRTFKMPNPNYYLP
jgi:putative acid phosphatase of HAD superfamily subfamily IIIB